MKKHITYLLVLFLVSCQSNTDNASITPSSLQAVEKVNMAHPDLTPAMIHQLKSGESYFYQEQYEESQSAFKKLIELSPPQEHLDFAKERLASCDEKLFWQKPKTRKKQARQSGNQVKNGGMNWTPTGRKFWSKK